MPFLVLDPVVTLADGNLCLFFLKVGLYHSLGRNSINLYKPRFYVIVIHLYASGTCSKIISVYSLVLQALIAKRSDMVVMSGDGPLKAYVHRCGYVHDESPKSYVMQQSYFLLFCVL